MMKKTQSSQDQHLQMLRASTAFGELSSTESIIRYYWLLIILQPQFIEKSFKKVEHFEHNVVLLLFLLTVGTIGYGEFRVSCPAWSLSSSTTVYCVFLDCPAWSLSSCTVVYCVFWIVQHGVCYQVLLFIVCFWIVQRGVCHQVLLFLVFLDCPAWSLSSGIVVYCVFLDCPAWSLSSGTVVCCVFWDCPAWSLSSGTVVYCELWKSSSSWGLMVRPYVPSLDQSQLLCQRIAFTWPVCVHPVFLSPCSVCWPAHEEGGVAAVVCFGYFAVGFNTEGNVGLFATCPWSLR